MEWFALFEFKKSARVQDTNDLNDWEELVTGGHQTKQHNTHNTKENVGKSKWTDLQLERSLWSVFEVRVMTPFKEWMDRRGVGGQAKMTSAVCGLVKGWTACGFHMPEVEYGDEMKKCEDHINVFRSGVAAAGF